jgi:uncharacterized protein
MQRGCLAWLAGLLLVLASIPGLSQGIDCGKARSPIDLAICASPALMAQDRLLAETYGQALANDPAHADAIRQAQRQWLSERARSCASAPQKAAPDCLSRFYASRLSALSGTATAAAAMSADVPQPDASLETDRFATAGEHATLLRVKQPGRFAIKAESPTGTALQLVDMLTARPTSPASRGQAMGVWIFYWMSGPTSCANLARTATGPGSVTSNSRELGPRDRKRESTGRFPTAQWTGSCSR